MTPSVLRLVAILLAVAAAVAAILNLHRVGNLGMPWLPPLLLVAAGAVIVFSKRRKK